MHPTPDHDSTDDSWSALVARAGAGGALGPLDIAPLHAYVCDYVRAAKARGDTPEQVIVALKRHTAPALSLHERPGRHHELVSLIFHWCLDEYYGPEPSAGGHPSLGASPARRS